MTIEDRFRENVIGQVEARQVIEAEGTHGMAGAIDTGLVDILKGSHAHLKHPLGLFPDNGKNTVQEETAYFFPDMDGYLVDLQAEVQHTLRRFVRDMRTLDYFDQLHGRRRVKEMELADLRGAIGNIGDAGTDDERAVSGKNGLCWSQFVQRTETA
jgi:hypothetical protein